MTTKKTLKLTPGKMIYHNMEFIDSDVGRPIRILSEFMGPYQIFRQEGIKNTIVFFGSARTLPPDEIKKRRKGCKDKKELARLDRLEKVADSYNAARMTLLCRENNLDVVSAHVQEVRTKQVLFGAVADLHLRDGDKVLVLADIVGETFVAEGVDFTRDNKAVGPNFY